MNRALLTVVIATALMIVGAAPALAGNVDHAADDSLDGSLRFEVNNASPGELITFSPGVNPVLNSAMSFPTFLTLRGNGIGATTINGPANARVFTIGVGGTQTIEDLTITGGHAPNGTAPGGVGQGGGDGQNGGAIRFIPGTAGTLSIDSVLFNANHAGTGANGADGQDGANGGAAGEGGDGGEGGAIYLQDGAVGNASLTITNSIFEANTAGNGGNGGIGGDGGFNIGNNGGDGGAGGPGGYGGAIDDFAGGTVTITDTTFTNNVAGSAGNGGAAGEAFIDGGGSSGGSGGRGGGYVGSGVTISKSTFNGNLAGNGGNGGVGVGGGFGGAGAFGGGVSAPGQLTLVNSTFKSNASGTGGNGVGFTGNGGAGGVGGAVQAFGPGTTLTNLTVSQNTAGGGGTSVAASPGAPGTGAGVYSNGGGVTLTNWLIANNTNAQGTQTTANCDGVFTFSTFGISFPANTGCAGSNGDPLLGPLQNNGGPTQTMLPGLGSAAIDRAPVGADCPGTAITDQRGVLRPQGPACDLGAVEVVPIAPVQTTTNTTAATTKKKKCKKKKRKGKKKRCKKKKKKK